MIKFQIKCPNCNKQINYNILGRDYNDIKCPHCKKKIDVQLRYLVPVISLAIFFFCYQAYDVVLKSYFPLLFVLIAGAIISFILTLLIGQWLVKKFGDGILFETRIKTKMEKKKS